MPDVVLGQASSRPTKVRTSISTTKNITRLEEQTTYVPEHHGRLMVVIIQPHNLYVSGDHQSQ